MSRFDDELIKQAENAYQMRNLPDATTPKQPHIQDYQPYGDSLVPAEVPVAEEAADWSANQPMRRQLEVRDLEAADPADGQPGEIVGMPGMSQVYPLGGPDPLIEKAASVDPIDESLYNVYKASREIRDAIVAGVDFNFDNLLAAANDASTVMRYASNDDEIKNVVGTVASIVSDIENDLATSGDYRQASADLQQFEGLLEEINKVAAKEEDDSDGDDCVCDGKGTCKSCKKKAKSKKKKDKKAAKQATNGNQETGVTIDVRDLDDQAGLFNREKEMTPDHHTEVLVGEDINAEAAGYVDFYNDGSSTGITPGDEPNKQVVWPNDGTNPAYAPYNNQVQASREKIFDALQVVERLEKLGMVNHDDRAKHIAKFEQMSDAKLAGFKVSLDMLEESGARQPRSQKVASGTNRMPEMGRLTTASTVSRQDVQSDDWLMTL